MNLFLKGPRASRLDALSPPHDAAAPAPTLSDDVPADVDTFGEFDDLLAARRAAGRR
jgi:hypothetical protein